MILHIFWTLFEVILLMWLNNGAFLINLFAWLQNLAQSTTSIWSQEYIKNRIPSECFNNLSTLSTKHINSHQSITYLLYLLISKKIQFLYINNDAKSWSINIFKNIHENISLFIQTDLYSRFYCKIMISIDRGQAYFICVFYGKFMVMNFISNFMSVLNNGRNLYYEFLGIFRLVF